MPSRSAAATPSLKPERCDFDTGAVWIMAILALLGPTIACVYIDELFAHDLDWSPPPKDVTIERLGC